MKETTFSNNLRARKKELGYTQQQLATKLKKKRCTVAAWLEGRAEPKIDDQVRVMEVFKINDWKKFIE